MMIPEVVSISPDIAALAPEINRDLPLSARRFLPPANRIAASGKIKRKIATVLRTSSVVSTGSFP